MSLDEFPYRFTTPSGTYLIYREGDEYLAVRDDEIVAHNSDIGALSDDLRHTEPVQPH